MSYTKQNFVDGMILKAEHLNKIEDGIEAATNQQNATTTKVNEYEKNLDLFKSIAMKKIYISKPNYSVFTTDGIEYPSIKLEYEGIYMIHCEDSAGIVYSHIFSYDGEMTTTRDINDDLRIFKAGSYMVVTPTITSNKEIIYGYVITNYSENDIQAISNQETLVHDLGTITDGITLEEKMKNLHIAIENYLLGENGQNYIFTAMIDNSVCLAMENDANGETHIYYHKNGEIKQYYIYYDEQDVLTCKQVLINNEHIEDNSITTEKLANGSITPEKTSFVETSRNLVNINNSENVNGKYLNRGTGKEVENTAYSISHYIEATPSEVFICNKDLYSYAWYTADKTLLYGSTTDLPAGVPITISANTSLKYIRICAKTSDFNGLQFERGSEVTKYTEYDELTIPKLNIESNKTFYVGSGRKIKTLKEGIEIATKYNGAKLYVDSGTYDLVNEFGQDYLDNTSTDKGLILKSNVHIIFSSRAKVLFNYTGNNAFIHKEFSPFNAGVYGFTLENLTLECSNCRYAIHDERGGSTDTYHNRYLNMKITIDNSNNPNWTNSHNIGGGLGNDGYIEVIGNIFNHAVTYHNNNNTGYTSSKSKVIIKDNFFSAGGVGCQGYGASTEITEFLVVNNTIDWLSINTENANNINVSAFNNIIKYPS